jgi:glycosyltransferase involved in cell wall biosynthesis
MYEQYTHYVPGDSETLKRFVADLSTRYANLCNRVFVPSESIAAVLRARKVVAPIDVVPTGVSLELFETGSGKGFRAAMAIPKDAFVVGHVGRLAPEKNLAFLTEALVAFLEAEPRAHALLVGRGPSESMIRHRFQDAGLTNRLHYAGVLSHPLLASAYRAMDVFAFTSKSETQGMVLTEASAAGVPVVALDAPGVREVVVDEKTGRLLDEETIEAFCAALRWVVQTPPQRRRQLRRAAKQMAERCSLDRSADKALAVYRDLRGRSVCQSPEDENALSATLNLIRAEWDLLMSVVGAAGAALAHQDENAASNP